MTDMGLGYSCGLCSGGGITQKQFMAVRPKFGVFEDASPPVVFVLGLPCLTGGAGPLEDSVAKN